MLPLECQFLNKAALTATAGQIPSLVRHFQIKRKPKSATLRAEILQKCKKLYHCSAVFNNLDLSLCNFINL